MYSPCFRSTGSTHPAGTAVLLRETHHLACDSQSTPPRPQVLLTPRQSRGPQGGGGKAGGPLRVPRKPTAASDTADSHKQTLSENGLPPERCFCDAMWKYCEGTVTSRTRKLKYLT